MTTKTKKPPLLLSSNTTLPPRTVSELQELMGLLVRRHGRRDLGIPFAVAHAITGEVARRRAGNQPEVADHEYSKNSERVQLKLTPEVFACLDWLVEQDTKAWGMSYPNRSLSLQIAIPRELKSYKDSLAEISASEELFSPT